MSQFLLWVLIVSSGVSNAPQRSQQPDRSDCAHFGLSSPSVYEGTIHVCPADLTADPRWQNPTTDPVPLAVPDAVRKTREALQRFDPREQRWQVREVSLSKINERWVYRVDWRVPDSNKAIAYVVTLSGRVLTPELERSR